MTASPVGVGRVFVPREIDLSDVSQLTPWYTSLRDRLLDTPEAVDRWMSDYSELSAAVGEYGSRTNIDAACHTDHAEIEARFLHFIETVSPAIQPFGFELKKKLLEAPCRDQLDPGRYRVLLREWQSDVDLFREENIPLATQIAKLNQDYDKRIGAMTVTFQGEQRTLQQMARFLEQTDRAVRQEAWTLIAQRRLDDRQAIDQLFDRMLGLRQQMATHADKADFRDYTWASYNRFDYTPGDCLAFGEAIEAVIVPQVRRLDEQRREALGVDRLMPWDLAVDVHGRPPLHPFDAHDVGMLRDRTQAIFEQMDPSLAQDFATLSWERNLDLDSRKGKRAGGFQASLLESGQPFIFMNAAGQQRDVETLLHEAGHAFHFMWAHRAQPWVFLRSAPIEFCEVASMSMELFGSAFLDVFYPDPADADRARRVHLEGILRIFPWIAIIDGYQHWLYTHPGHTLAQRTDAWLQLLDRFESGVVDWSGHPDARAAGWHRQLHLFHCPFYYVEYGIAQLGALQLGQRYRQDPAGTLADYRQALTRGGSCGLPELFAAAGIPFDFGCDTLEPLIAWVVDELDRLPA